MGVVGTGPKTNVGTQGTQATGHDDLGNLNPSSLSHEELVDVATKLLPSCRRDVLVQVVAFMLDGRKNDNINPGTCARKNLSTSASILRDSGAINDLNDAHVPPTTRSTTFNPAANDGDNSSVCQGQHWDCNVPIKNTQTSCFSKKILSDSNQYEHQSDLKQNSPCVEIRMPENSALSATQNNQLNQCQKWENHFEQLLKYRAQHGHVDVKQGDKFLGSWVKRQRELFKKTKMPEYRIRKLEEVGFKWSLKMSPPENKEMNDKKIVDGPRTLTSKTCQDKHWNYGNLEKDKQTACSAKEILPNQQQQQPNPKQTSPCMKIQTSKNSAMAAKQSSDIGHDFRASIATAWDNRFEDLLKYRAQHGHVDVSNNDPLLGSWVQRQRAHFRQNKMPQYCILKLEEVGFKLGSKNPINLEYVCHHRNGMSVLEERWEEKFKRLLEFKEINGHVNVPQKYSKDNQLAEWVQRQRQNYKLNILSDEHVERLERAGFQWAIIKTGDRAGSSNDEIWKMRFRQLLEYREVHGNVDVTNHYEENPRLLSWVKMLRVRYQKGILSEERIQRLNDINFIWRKQKFAHKLRGKTKPPRRQRESLSEMWEKNFQRLVEFKQSKGHVNVPYPYSEDKKLSYWLRGQRERYKKKIISQEQIERLENLGIQWNILKTGDREGLTNDEIWEMRFQQLLEYRKVNGHVDVPIAYEENRRLGRWVFMIRTRYHKGILSEERIQRLNDINFTWRIRKS